MTIKEFPRIEVIRITHIGGVYGLTEFGYCLVTLLTPNKILNMDEKLIYKISIGVYVTEAKIIIERNNS